MKSADETLRTSWTLVARLRNPNDQDSWQEFYEFYRRLIVGVAKKAGLTDEEAEDVMQETMRAFSCHVHDGKFATDAAHGSLRAWLLQTARWRIQDQLDKRLPVGSANEAPTVGTSATPTIERVPDAHPVNLEGLCDAEWKERLLQEALKAVQYKVKAEHYQIFHLSALEQRPIEEVARIVGANRAQVYLIKHRVGSALKKILKGLEKEMA